MYSGFGLQHDLYFANSLQRYIFLHSLFVPLPEQVEDFFESLKIFRQSSQTSNKISAQGH